jgi:hypothetical protein
MKVKEKAESFALIMRPMLTPGRARMQALGYESSVKLCDSVPISSSV